MTEIVVIEPQCRSYQHVGFNAGLLAAIARAYPAVSIRLVSEEEHAAQVVFLLAGYARSRLDIQTVPLPAPSLTGAWPRLAWELRRCLWLCGQLKVRPADALIFASVTAEGLLVLKGFLANKFPRTTIAAFPHSLLIGVERPTKRLWNRPISIGTALRFSSPANLSLVLLSETAWQAVAGRFPRNVWVRMTEPRIFREPLPPVVASPKRLRRVVLLGTLRCWIADLPEVLSAIRRMVPGLELLLAGHLVGKRRDCQRVARYLQRAPRAPVPWDEYASTARAADYCLSISDGIYYRYAGSGSILDAVEFCKPGLYLRHPLAEEYMRQLGPFGYAFRSSKELTRTASLLAEAIPAHEYSEQVRTLITAREYFSPETAAPQLRGILESGPSVRGRGTDRTRPEPPHRNADVGQTP